MIAFKQQGLRMHNLVFHPLSIFPLDFNFYHQTISCFSSVLKTLKYCNITLILSFHQYIITVAEVANIYPCPIYFTIF